MTDADAAHHDWDADAADYDAIVDRLEPELAKASAALLDAAAVGPGDRVLDVACGPGHTTAAATARGAEATGLDASTAMIDIARRRFPGTAFVVGDMLHPPVGPWDAIVCRMGAHHVDPAWLAAALGVLRPGGRIAIGETDATTEAARNLGMRRPKEWEALLAAAGFRHVSTSPSGADLSTIPPDAWTDLDAGGGHGHHPGDGDAGAAHDGHGHPEGPIYVIAGTRPAAQSPSL